MKIIPNTEHPLVLRTDFSNQAAWVEICTEIRKPVGSLHFLADVEYLNDVDYANIAKQQLLKLLPRNYDQNFIIVADRIAMERPEHPLLIVDLVDGSAREFRAIPSQIQSIENNLSIANLDFDDFSNAADENGVFRGFPGDPSGS